MAQDPQRAVRHLSSLYLQNINPTGAKWTFSQKYIHLEMSHLQQNLHPTPLDKLFPILELHRASLAIAIAPPHAFPYLESMDLHLNNPDLQAKLDRWVTETGRGPDELLEDAMAGYFDELTQVREMLDSHYDDLKSGRVKPISRDEIVAHFRAKSAAARRQQSGE